MSRNIVNYAESGKRKLEKMQRYNLTAAELRTICGTPHDTDDIYNAVCMAFNAGFEAGTRAQGKVGADYE